MATESATDRKMRTIIGFGSLLDEKSARRTFPDLINFRRGKVLHYRRIFNLVGISCIVNGYASADDIYIATCCASKTEEQENHELLVTLFEVDETTLDAFYEREHRLKICEVPFYEYNEDKIGGFGLICCEYND